MVRGALRIVLWAAAEGRDTEGRQGKSEVRKQVCPGLKI